MKSMWDVQRPDVVAECLECNSLIVSNKNTHSVVSSTLLVVVPHHGPLSSLNSFAHLYQNRAELMSTKPLNLTYRVPQNVAKQNELVQTAYFAEAKQWHLRSNTATKESAWISPIGELMSDPQRNADTKMNIRKHESIPERKQTRIYQSITTTQTVGTKSELVDIRSERPSDVPPREIKPIHTHRNAARRSSAFAFDTGREMAEVSHGIRVVSSSPSLDIINGYISGEDDDLEEDSPRSLPNNLPPVPDLPPLLATLQNFNPRKPQTLEELQERSQRSSSDSSQRSNDPLNPASLQPPLARHIADPLMQQARRIGSRSSGSPKMAFHQKSISQSHLLPLHYHFSPYLTVDKPCSESRIASRSYSTDLVIMHWVLFGCFTAFPPLWLLLAGGAFDSILHVPSFLRTGTMTDAEMRDLRRIRTIKILAGVLGALFTILCLAGFVVGLAYI